MSIAVNMAALQDQKHALRQQMLQSRRDFFSDHASREAANLGIQQQALGLIRSRGCRSVFVYLATPEEVQTAFLIDRLVAQDITVLVPRLVAPRDMRAVLFDGVGTLERGQLGIPSPRSDLAFQGAIDLALIPGLAFSREGSRLGYGKGYYDRWLAARPEVARIGLGFTQQVLPAVPMDLHDQRLDALVTQDEVLEITSGRQ